MLKVFDTICEARCAAADYFAIDSQPVSVEMIFRSTNPVGETSTKSVFIHRDGRWQTTQFED